MSEQLVHLTIDCETELIGRGRKAPRMACMSASTGKAHELLTPDEGCDLIERWLRLDQGWLIGHNVSFDLAVILKHRPSLAPHIWRLYDLGRVWDTGIHERLYALYHGWDSHPEIGRSIISQGVSLAQLASGLLDLDLSDQKLDPKSPRYQYGRLIGIPLEEWSEEARSYALEDARITHQIFERQQERLLNIKHNQRGEYRSMASFELQVKAAWALHHLEIWGLRTSRDRVDAFTNDLTQERAELERELKEFGLLKSDGKRDMSAIRAVIEACYGEDAPRSQTGLIQTSDEVLVDSGSEILLKLAKWLKLDKVSGTFTPTVESATERPLNPRWNVLVKSGRTSCVKPNLQQLPQEGGVRECFEPRENYVYVGCDYSTAELLALAQVCVNLGLDSEMARTINQGRDLHLALAADLAGVTYERALELKAAQDPEINKLRKLAKIPNFGLPGGLGVAGLVGFAKGYGLKIDEERAEELKRAWFNRWPEMRGYFNHVKSAVERGWLEQHYSGRRRGGIGFTDSANSYFQGLVADGAKSALYDVVRASWMEPKSPLYGSRPVLFIHDEIILEVPEERAPEAADELARLMLQAMKPFTPDLNMQAEAWVSRRWSKGIEELRDATGRHVIQD